MWYHVRREPATRAARKGWQPRTLGMISNDKPPPDARVLPMFPLGSVIFPHMLLPLHVFEPRYRALVSDVLADDGVFGVPLISRGHEVGGGDERTDIGTLVRVLRAEPLDDGRWLVIGLGTERFRVTEWLPDEPYPRARVAPFHDEVTDHDDAGRRDRLTAPLRRVLAMLSELGEDAVPATFDLDEDPELAAWQAAVVAPLNPFDAQRVLACTRLPDRLDLLAELLTGLEQMLSFQLAGAGQASDLMDGELRDVEAADDDGTDAEAADDDGPDHTDGPH